jgi:dCTP deaminase
MFAKSLFAKGTEMPQGVYTKQMLTDAVTNGRLVRGENFKQSHIGPASVDLTIGGVVYEVDCLFPPRQQSGEKVLAMLQKAGMKPIQPGNVLYPGKTYVAKASLSANFPPGVYGYANAKSTSGRCFLLVRTISDECMGFDAVDRRDRGYTGDIWLVIQPLVFPVILTHRECFNQLRLFNADTRFSKADLRELLATTDLLFRTNREPYNQGELSLDTHRGDVMLTLHAPPGEVVGYRALPGAPPLDLSFQNGSLDPRAYYERVFAKGEDGNSYVDLVAGSFYILATHEMVKIPLHLCAEMRALDPRLGLFFSHFAGFFDPGFFGTITLEVMPMFNMQIRHGDPVANLQFEHLAGETVSYANGGSYQGQVGAKLPKQFGPWWA